MCNDCQQNSGSASCSGRIGNVGSTGRNCISDISDGILSVVLYRPYSIDEKNRKKIRFKMRSCFFKQGLFAT